MKYEDYEAIAKDVTADNSLDVVRAMLEKAKTDAVEYDAEISDMTNKLNESENKYKSLQVDYIQRFTSNSAASYEHEEVDDVEAAEREIEEIMKNI